MKMFAVMNVCTGDAEPTVPVRLPAKLAGEV